MTYKGYRIDKKLNIYDLREQKIAEKVENIDKAKEIIDAELEKQHKKQR